MSDQVYPSLSLLPFDSELAPDRLGIPISEHGKLGFDYTLFLGKLHLSEVSNLHFTDCRSWQVKDRLPDEA